MKYTIKILQSARILKFSSSDLFLLFIASNLLNFWRYCSLLIIFVFVMFFFSVD